MNIATFLVTFGCSWWIIFFILLPIGVQQEENPEPGHDTGAPKTPNLKRKALITTLLTLIFTFVFFAILDIIQR